jgi:hypothetical protein
MQSFELWKLWAFAGPYKVLSVKQRRATGRTSILAATPSAFESVQIWRSAAQNCSISCSLL